jgi:hypothetical protein
MHSPTKQEATTLIGYHAMPVRHAQKWMGLCPSLAFPEGATIWADMNAALALLRGFAHEEVGAVSATAGYDLVTRYDPPAAYISLPTPIRVNGQTS